MKNQANTPNLSNYDKSIMLIGRITTGIAMLVFLAYPIMFSIRYNAWPDPAVFFKAAVGVIPIYWTVGVIEALTFVPMLGVGGSFLGFVTGNLTALKVPCAINAVKAAQVEQNSPEADAVSTIAIAVSSIVTIIIIFIGMLLLRPLTPLLESKTLAPAFDALLPALFGALAVIFIAKNWKIAVAPMLLMLALFIIMPALAGAVSLLVPVGAIFAIAVSRILYKKGILG